MAYRKHEPSEPVNNFGLSSYGQLHWFPFLGIVDKNCHSLERQAAVYKWPQRFNVNAIITFCFSHVEPGIFRVRVIAINWCWLNLLLGFLEREIHLKSWMCQTLKLEINPDKWPLRMPTKCIWIVTFGRITTIWLTWILLAEIQSASVEPYQLTQIEALFIWSQQMDF